MLETIRDVTGPPESGLLTWICLPGTPLVRARGQQGAPVLGNEELENRVTQSFSGSSQSWTSPLRTQLCWTVQVQLPALSLTGWVLWCLILPAVYKLSVSQAQEI